MPSVDTSGNSVWDPSTTEPERPSFQDTEDNLPPFAHLINDEQRELKAALHKPGKFTVIANHNTFSSLPEYRSQHGVAEKSISDPDDFEITDSVILEKLEEKGEDYESSIASNPCIPNQSSSISQSSRASRLLSETESGHCTARPEAITLQHPEDAQLLGHYRKILARQICPLSDWVGGQDLFERYAQDYPPLMLAIMALSSLSLACLESRPVTGALERHQHVIPALKSEVRTFEDSFSDGALFTHYFLLRFEEHADDCIGIKLAATAGHRESNMWDYHSDQLLRILRLRHRTYGPERHNFVLVWAMYIDIYGLLATSSTGFYTTAIIQEGMLPPPEKALEHAKPGHMASGLVHSNDTPQLLRMNRQLTLLALEFGRKAQELRAEAIKIHDPVNDTALHQQQCIKDEYTLLADFYSKWSVQLSPSDSWLEELAVLPTAIFTLRIHIGTLS
ncbi:hypothetical protein ACMFMG_000982 [Clarireedia jacksonii]